MLAGESPKSMQFGLSPRTELLTRFILSRALKSATSPGTASKPINPPNKDVEWPFTAKDSSIGVLNGSAFLPLFAIMGRLGLITSWFPKRNGEVELRLEPGLGEFKLDFVLADLTSYGVDPPLTVQLTFSRVWKMRAQLRATSVMLAFGSTVWHRFKISCTPTTSTVMSGLISLMMTGMIFGTNRLINNFCVNLPLVV